jgi:hypothetical protein
VAGLFPPEDRDWGLPTEVPLSPQAARRLAREAAVQSFDNAARAINEDWRTSYDGKQIQRYGEALGRRVVASREQEVRACEAGRRPRGPVNDPELLVIGMDGGRVQGREKDSTSGSRWREDKIVTVTSYLPGDGKEKDPTPLVTTLVATMGDAKALGRLARVEAERRGIRQAKRVLVIGDAGNWIDSQHQAQFPRHERIVDYCHASGHAYDAAKAVHAEHAEAQYHLGNDLETLLWRGRALEVAHVLGEWSKRLGPPQEQDPPGHPRRVVAENAGYFQRHAQHMNYPAYRKRGWPIGSGVTEAGVKQFNKRVKGTEQFWSQEGAEAILALRGLWLSQDKRWDHYWLYGRLPRQPA